MRRLALGLSLFCAIALGIGGLVTGLSDRRLAQERGARVVALEAELDGAGERIVTLEAELREALARAELVTREAAERRAELERMIADSNLERSRPFQAMPEGVRLALRAIEELLGQEGYDSFRFLRAERIEDSRLYDCELIETNLREHRVAYYKADELRLSLDRESGVLTLAMTGGHVVVDGYRQDFGEDGWRLSLMHVDGPLWERRLPYLVEAGGAYPPDPEVEIESEGLDPITRAEWQERIDGLLARAGTAVSWRLDRFDDLDGAYFTGCLVLGYRQQRLLERSAEAARVAIEVDRQSDSVSLLLEDGILRLKAGNSSIAASGYRILLPDLNVEDAVEAMLGKVLERTR